MKTTIKHHSITPQYKLFYIMQSQRTNNGLLLSDVIKGIYYKKTYQGYTMAEAKRLFRQYIKDEQKATFVNTPKKDSRKLYNEQTKAPRYIRCYYDANCLDNYTIIFTRKKESFGYKDKRRHRFLNIGCNSTLSVYHKGETHFLIDWPRYKHLGKRIEFSDLPDAVQSAVVDQYKSLWNITD